MRKKKFTNGLSTLLGETPNKVDIVNKFKEEQIEVRTSVVLEKKILDKIKGIAYWDRVSIKEVMSQMLSNEVKKYEKEKGELKPIPNK